MADLKDTVDVGIPFSCFEVAAGRDFRSALFSACLKSVVEEEEDLVNRKLLGDNIVTRK